MCERAVIFTKSFDCSGGPRSGWAENVAQHIDLSKSIELVTESWLLLVTAQGIRYTLQTHLAAGCGRQSYVDGHSCAGQTPSCLGGRRRPVLDAKHTLEPDQAFRLGGFSAWALHGLFDGSSYSTEVKAICSQVRLIHKDEDVDHGLDLLCQQSTHGNFKTSSLFKSPRHMQTWQGVSNADRSL